MRLHVLSGCRNVLRPATLDAHAAAELIGPRIHPADAGWLAGENSEDYHDFLQDEPNDQRTTVMARALLDNFGKRFEPLIVLADLLDEIAAEGNPVTAASKDERRSQITVLDEILASGHIDHLILHGVALPSKSDPEAAWAVPAGIVPGIARERIEKLSARIRKTADRVRVETRVIEATRRECPAFHILFNNALSWHFAHAFTPRVVEYGWQSETDRLAAAIAATLAEWNESGLYAGIPMLPENLEATAEPLFQALLRH